MSRIVLEKGLTSLSHLVMENGRMSKVEDCGLFPLNRQKPSRLITFLRIFIFLKAPVFI